MFKIRANSKLEKTTIKIKRNHTKANMKFGYAIQSGTPGNATNTRIILPEKLEKVRLTPTNSKFIFYGTRNEILEWMLLNDNLTVEYDPMEGVLSPPCSPSLNPFLSSPMADRRTSSESNSSDGSQTSTTTRTKPPYLTFDLYGQSIKNTPLLSDDIVFCRPLHLAVNHLPWLNILLEIRPTDPKRDAKYTPVKRVILPSGLSMYEISKALEKCWRNPIPHSLGLFQRPPPSERENQNSSDFEENNPLLDWLAHHKSSTFPTPTIFSRWQHKNSIIPPGVLTPYIYDEVMQDQELVESKSIEAGQSRDQKKELANEEKNELNITDLPRYENVNEDRLLEMGDAYIDEKLGSTS
ncbi:hypothetical protein G9A89_002262 [Geosiphon pyriformis]|nr:hypothetical protein G9A89_002262 [Geosiphon pyriformis]